MALRRRRLRSAENRRRAVDVEAVAVVDVVDTVAVRTRGLTKSDSPRTNAFRRCRRSLLPTCPPPPVPLRGSRGISRFDDDDGIAARGDRSNGGGLNLSRFPFLNLSPTCPP